MSLATLVTQDSVLTGLRVSGKKQLMHELAAEAARLTGLPARAVFDTLLQRERLGSTGIGNGIAIPHGRLAGLGRLCGLFARLEKPIEYDAVDGLPVDLVFVILAPENAGADHLQALAKAARVLRQPRTTQKLRQTSDALALHAILCEGEASRAA